ncbi:MAG: transporter [bacterium]
MKRLVLILTIVAISALFISGTALAGFERSLHNNLDIETPTLHNLELGFIGDFASGQEYGLDNNIDVSIIDLYAKYGFTDDLEFGIDVPYKEWNTDKNISFPDLTSSDGEDGISDMNIWAKYRFVKEADKKFGAAAGVNIKLKNGDENKGLGTGKYDVMPFVIATYKFQEPLLFGARIGYNIVGEPDDVKWDNELYYSFWTRYTFSDQLGIVGEVNGNSMRAGNLTGNRSDAVEVDGGVTYGVTPNVGLVAGAGIGLTDNAPDWRFFVSLKTEFVAQ